MVIHMRATWIVLLVTMSMLPVGELLSVPLAAGYGNITVTTTTFGSGTSDVTVDFPSAIVNTDNSISVQSGVYIDQARLKVSSVAQPPGNKDYPTNVTIDFGGDTQLEWQWRGPGYGPLGHQTTFINNKEYMNATLGKFGPYNDTVSFRLPKTANVKSATMNLSAGSRIGDPGKVLVLYACNPYYGWQDSAKNVLASYTNDFSQVDSFDAHGGTPTWDDIKDYGSILTFTDWDYGYGYSDNKAIGDLLANYVDAGGSLVLCEFCFYNGYGSFTPAGRFLDQNYYALSPNGNIYSTSSGLGNIAEPDNPVMTNVSTISYANYYGSEYTYLSGISSANAGSTAISYYGAGYVLAAEKNVGGVTRVDLQVWPVRSDSSYYQWMTYTGDQDQLMKNSLLYAGRKPIDFSFDLFNDSQPEVNVTDFMGNYTLPDFSAQLNSYLASHDPTYTDVYGNQFVDIPINVTGAKLGTLSCNKLNIYYDYSTQIDANPSGNLTSSLADLQATVQSQDPYNIPIYISTASAGKIELSDLFISMTPPNHAPRIDSFFPPVNTVVMEDTSLDFGANATDIYGNPVSYAWSVDGVPVDGAVTNRLTHYFDFDSSGAHLITATVSNPISAKTFTTVNWNIVVLNVNRPPAITDFTPVSNPSINENTTQEFTVTASDPDKEDANGLTYTWFLEGKVVKGVAGNNYTYVTDFKSNGNHTVKVIVSDLSNATDSKSWTVTVIDVDVAPTITDFSPSEDPTITETDSWTFSVTPFDPDANQALLVNWYVDDLAIFIGNPYTFTTDYKSAGVHKIKATVSDGQLSLSKIWTVTVLNLNRAPQAVIDSPADQSENMQGDAIHFSAKSSTDPDNDPLSFSWKEGGANVSDQMEFDRAFSPGIHTLVLEVRDGQGGLNSTSVRFRVRYIEIATEIGLDRLEVQAGNKVDVILTMTNIGDADAGNMTLTVSVDGTSIGSAPLTAIKAGGAEKQIFNWKATKGDHTITAKIGDQTWTKQVTVGAAPAPAVAAGIGDYIWPIVLVVLVVGMLGFGAAVLRKK